MRGAQVRQENEHQRIAWQVWHTVALGRVKKFPSLEKFVTGKAAKPAHQPPEVLQAMGEALARSWGVEVRK